MKPRTANILALSLLLAAFACLIPGIARPALTLDISPTLPFLGKVTLYNQTRSILGTARNLYETGNHLVAVLILTFSVAVPAIKGMLLIYALGFRNAPGRMRLFRFVGAMSKWSMADVFVMGIFLAFLGSGAANGVTARLHEGFWFFLGYCLMSVASAQLMRMDMTPPVQRTGSI